MIYLRLFLCFAQIGLFSIGGGYAAVPLIQAQVVDSLQWLSLSEFTDLVTIAEMTPGPIAINAATFVGTRLAGLPGALCATLGCIVPSLVIVSVLAFLYGKYRNGRLMKNTLSSLRPAVVGLIASACLGILFLVLTGQRFSFGGFVSALGGFRIAGAALFAAAIVAIRKFKVHPIIAMAACGAVNLLLGIVFPAAALK